MGWVRQHKVSRRVLAIGLVVGEPGRFRVRLADAASRRSHEAPHCYLSASTAFAAAEAFTRNRLGGHQCSTECSEWVDPVDPV